jgi:hypothetical protein
MSTAPSAAATTRVAMWSGPRNLSTALLYSFGNRADCVVWDEPFYAFSLRRAGNAHPLRDEILATYDDDHDRVAARCLGPAPGGARVFYQKHMTHHMRAGHDRSWIAGLSNAFLIRDPARVLASYKNKWDAVTLEAIGCVQAVELFDVAADALGAAPPVLDADDLLARPERALTRLCDALAIPFDRAMLSWPAGPKPFDGVWAKHWYDAVWRSTGFATPSPHPGPLPDPLRRIADEAAPYYQRLAAHRLRTDEGPDR